MTDYLEEMLEEQEPEDLPQTTEWKKPRIFMRGEASPSDSVSFVAGVSLTPKIALPRGQSELFKSEETAILARAEQADSHGQMHGENGTAVAVPEETVMPLSVQAESAVWSLEWELKRLRRAVLLWEGQRSVRIEQGIAAGVSGNSFSYGPIPGSGRAADYAALVDAAFARDARRYDGPLRLL